MRANEEALRATFWNLRRATNIHGDIFVSNAKSVAAPPHFLAALAAIWSLLLLQLTRILGGRRAVRLSQRRPHWQVADAAREGIKVPFI